MIVVNEVGVDKVFGADTNAATVIGADGAVHRLPEQPKGGPGRRRLGPRLSAAAVTFLTVGRPAFIGSRRNDGD
ncbi:hypothetical protein V2I01_29205 [Micromonospora sp. BRA006-A]|nr:hypothetical protein [Micromonospora sp. BRA006-A]